MKLDLAEVTPADIKQALARPDSFAYFGDEKELFKTWALGPVILTRDSDLITQSNATILKQKLEDMPEIADDWKIEKATHWACGWVEHLSYRVVKEDGSSTVVARFLASWFKALDDYPIADEMHLGELESEAEWKYTTEVTESVLRRNEGPDCTDTIVSDVLVKLNEMNPSGLEHDGNGYYPRDSEVKEALIQLGHLKAEEDRANE